MAYTQAQLDNIIAQLSTGAAKVRYASGTSIDYFSVDEALKLKAKMEAELGLTAAKTTRKYASTSKGL